MDVFYTVYETTRYPEKAALTVIHRRRVACTDHTDSDRLAILRPGTDFLELELHGTERAASQTTPDVRYFPPGGDAFVPLAGSWQGNRYYFQRPRGGYQFIALDSEVLDSAGL